jgi:hypothetical protein
VRIVLVRVDRARQRHAARECPRQESNLHPALRRRVLYPLSYEGAQESVAIRDTFSDPIDTDRVVW